MFYWQLIIPILLWFLKFIVQNWPNKRQESKIAKALRIMEETLAQSRIKGFRAEQGYTLEQMLK